MQNNASRYKNLSIWLAVGFGILVILILWLQLAGKITDMPGWS
jgi:hypothetical protein